MALRWRCESSFALLSLPQIPWFKLMCLPSVLPTCRRITQAGIACLTTPNSSSIAQNKVSWSYRYLLMSCPTVEEP